MYDTRPWSFVSEARCILLAHTEPTPGERLIREFLARSENGDTRTRACIFNSTIYPTIASLFFLSCALLCTHSASSLHNLLFFSSLSCSLSVILSLVEFLVDPYDILSCWVFRKSYDDYYYSARSSATTSDSVLKSRYFALVYQLATLCSTQQNSSYSLFTLWSSTRVREVHRTK